MQGRIFILTSFLTLSVDRLSTKCEYFIYMHEGVGKKVPGLLFPRHKPTQRPCIPFKLGVGNSISMSSGSL